MIVMRYCTYNLTGVFPLNNFYLGDDSIVILPDEVSPTEFEDFAFDKFSMALNVEKSLITERVDQVNFIGYFNHNGLAVRSIDTMLSSCIYPEHTRDNKLETITRMEGQALPWTLLKLHKSSKQQIYPREEEEITEVCY